MAKSTYKSNKKFDKKSIKKIGSLPSGYDKNDVVYIKDNKIYIAKYLSNIKI